LSHNRDILKGKTTQISDFLGKWFKSDLEGEREIYNTAEDE
jgi:hypothetical protein